MCLWQLSPSEAFASRGLLACSCVFTHTSAQTPHSSCCQEHHHIKPHCSDAAMHLHQPQGSLSVPEPNWKREATTGFCQSLPHGRGTLVLFSVVACALAGADTSVDARRLAGRLHCGQAAIRLLAARLVPTRHSSAETILADQSASVAAAVSAVCHGVLPTPGGAQGSSTSHLCQNFLSTSAAVYSMFVIAPSP